MSKSVDDNDLEPTQQIAIVSDEEDPGRVWIAINPPFALYGAARNEAVEIGRDIMEKALPPQPPLLIIESVRLPRPEEEREWAETGAIKGVAGWSVTGPLQIRSLP